MTNFTGNGLPPNMGNQITNQQFQNYQAVPVQQNFFQTPIGSIYSLNTASDINNIPVGANLSVGLCLPEAVMYIKSYQNGQPILLGYKLAPLEGSPTNNNESEGALSEKIVSAFKSFDKRLSEIEDKLKTKEEKLNWQI